MKVSRVYLKCCIVISTTLDIRLVFLDIIQTLVLSFDSWTKADDTDDIIKQKKLKFEHTKFKCLKMTSQPFYMIHEDVVESPCNT